MLLQLETERDDCYGISGASKPSTEDPLIKSIVMITLDSHNAPVKCGQR